MKMPLEEGHIQTEGKNILSQYRPIYYRGIGII